MYTQIHFTSNKITNVSIWGQIDQADSAPSGKLVKPSNTLFLVIYIVINKVLINFCVSHKLLLHEFVVYTHNHSFTLSLVFYCHICLYVVQMNVKLIPFAKAKRIHTLTQSRRAREGENLSSLWGGMRLTMCHYHQAQIKQNLCRSQSR